MAKVKKDIQGGKEAAKISSNVLSLVKNKRGSYPGAKERYTCERPKNYFKEIHEDGDFFLTWVDAVDRGNRKIYVSYKVQNDKKIYRTSRSKSVWFDEHGLEFALLTVQKWKAANNNSLGKGKLLPSFYVDHRVEFFKWLSNTAKHATIETYDDSLIQYIFPYFCEKLKLNNPKQWDLDSINRWEAFLSAQSLTPSTRNRKRTALNRYLRFLKQTGKIKKFHLILHEPVKKIFKRKSFARRTPRVE